MEVAGPYDELIYVPGLFSRKGRDVTTTYSPSITNIYVSSPASVMNGRKVRSSPHLCTLADPRTELGDSQVRSSLPPPSP